MERNHCATVIVTSSLWTEPF